MRLTTMIAANLLLGALLPPAPTAIAQVYGRKGWRLVIATDTFAKDVRCRPQNYNGIRPTAAPIPSDVAFPFSEFMEAKTIVARPAALDASWTFASDQAHNMPIAVEPLECAFNELAETARSDPQELINPTVEPQKELDIHSELYVWRELNKLIHSDILDNKLNNLHIIVEQDFQLHLSKSEQLFPSFRNEMYIGTINSPLKWNITIANHYDKSKIYRTDIIITPTTPNLSFCVKIDDISPDAIKLGAKTSDVEKLINQISHRHSSGELSPNPNVISIRGIKYSGYLGFDNKSGCFSYAEIHII